MVYRAAMLAPPSSPRPGLARARSLALIMLAQVLAMALWFSASAVAPAMQAEAGLGGFRVSLFTSAVQLGFVAGTLASALLTLPDRVDPKRLFAVSALIGAAANAAILGLPPGSWLVIVMRLITGVCMAGVYPVGMKLVASWAKADLGLLIGMLVGALTLGSAAPYLFNALAFSAPAVAGAASDSLRAPALGGIDWRFTLAAASLSAVAAALAIMLAGVGPNAPPSPRFDPRHAFAVLARAPLRLATFGYLGHMWELYAMWAWIGVFLNASLRLALPNYPEVAALAAGATFATIAAGALGCVVAGFYADRLGRTTLTVAAMTVSGGCALLIGRLFGGNPTLLILLSLVWGFAVVADSAQFSASIAELAERSLVGTMLTMQTSLGFLLTLVTIHLVPFLVAHVGWENAFSFLAIGPAAGVIAMLRLRARPEALRLAGGKR